MHAHFGYIGATFSGGSDLRTGGSADCWSTDTDSLRRSGRPQRFSSSRCLRRSFFLPESLSKADETKPASALVEIMRSLRDPRIAPILIQDLFNSMGLFGWFSVFALVVGAQLHFGPGDTSRMFSAFGVFSVILQIFAVGRTTDRFGSRTMSNIGFASLIAAFAFAPFMHNLWGAALLVAAFSFGMSHVNATIPALLTENAPANQRGSILGSAASLESFSGIFMPPISTGILGVVGTAGPAAISASCVAIALALGIRAQLVPVPATLTNATPAE